MKPTLAARLFALVAFFLAACAARAANIPPERFAAFPDLTLARGETPPAIPLSAHLRDPDVPGTAARITVRMAEQTRTIDLALHDAEAPLTVANFVAYVNAGRYAANFFHRSVPGFIIQNGGFYFINDTTFDYVPTFEPVKNEPGRSNLRGTVAMAKLGGDPDSATSQWFINLADNSANLDAQNGGFTVFAHVLGEGMTVADAIAATPRYDASNYASAWTDLPLTTGELARAHFIETDAAIVPALSHVVTSDDPTLVAATIENGALRLAASASRIGTTTIRLVTTDLEGGKLESSFSVAVSGVKPAISAGGHSLFLKRDSNAYAAGGNDYGQLGDGTKTSRSTPVPVMSDILAISVGDRHSLFLKIDGTVWATGWNGHGQLGDRTTTNRSSPVQVMSGVSAISAGDSHSLFLKNDGTVWAAGSGSALGAGTPDRSTPVQVMSGVSSISAGYGHSLFLKTEGTVWATGYNEFGQLGDGTTTYRSTPVQVMSGVSAISAGYGHSLFLKIDGSVYAAGYNEFGQLGDGTTTNRSVPVPVMSGVSTVSAGFYHSIFLKIDGTAWATGDNQGGELGDGTNTNQSTPVQVMSGVSAISACRFYSLFLKADDSVWGTANQTTPVQIKFPQTIVFASLPSTTFGDAPLTLSATATSALPVTYTVVSGPATLSGNTLTLTGASSVIIRASQAGNAEYSAAPSIENTITVAKAGQTIAFTPPATATLVDTPLTLSSTASSGLKISYDVVSGPATLFGNQLTLTAAGTVVIRATQAGNANYNPAPAIERTLTIVQIADAQIALQPRSVTYSGAPQTLTATTTPAGLRVTYTYKLGTAAPVSTAPTSPGVYTVTATLDDPAASNKPTASATLTISKAPLTVSAQNRSRLVGTANPALALSYSGLVGSDTPTTALTKAPVAATKADAKSAAGSYPITLTGGASANYALTLVPGTLTVVGFGGTYEALLLDQTSVPVGKLSLTIPTNALSYTGTLTLARESKAITVASTSKSPGTTAFAGSADLANATATWTRNTNGLDTLSLVVTVSADGSLTGSLKRKGEPFATLAFGSRLRVFAKGQTALGAGANTLVLHQADNLSNSASRPFPHGSGFATAPIAATTGVLTLKGNTADGSPLTASLKPTLDDTYLLWVNPYGTRADSFIAGALPLEDHPETTRFPGRAYIPRTSGLLTWQKAALPANTATAKLDKSYRAGFGPLDVEVSLDPWLPPATKAVGAIPSGTLAQRLGLAANSSTSGALTIAHGPAALDLGARESLLPLAASLSPAGVFTATNAAATAWTVKITPATGAFTGSFTLSDQIALPPAKPVTRLVTFSGVLRQAPAGDRELGAGFFLVPGFAVPKGAVPAEQPSGEIRFSTPATNR